MKKHRLLRVTALLFLFVIAPVWAFSQTTIRGTVTDESNQTLIGVNVMEVGTGNGVVTNIDGKFEIKVNSENASLSFTYIGYKSATIPLKGQKVLNISLEPDVVNLNEVVVVGYGTMKRSDLTGSVVSVNDVAIKKSVPTSIDQVLQGRAAGVQIQSNSGTPGASTAIRIRGINSINLSTQPIFVIDGVVVDASTSSESSNPLSNINPSDIVSMDVLKDASATAIYGSRASNGVIMITTKRGQTGESTVTYDGYVGWQSMPKHLDVMNLQEYARHQNERADAGILEKNSAFVRPDLLGEGTDWQKELFQNALMTNHNISITGGANKTTYSVSGGYLKQDGIALGSSFNRFTLRSNIDSEIKKWLKAGFTFSLADSKQEIGADNNTIMNALTYQPMVAVSNPDGSFDGPEDVWMPANPIGMASIRENYNKKYNFRANSYLEATIAKYFTFKTEYSTDYNWTHTYYFEPSYRFGVLESNTRTSKRSKNDSKYWSWRNILSYDNTFSGNHKVNLMIGQEMSEYSWENLGGAVTGFLTNTTHDLNAGNVKESSATGASGASSILSYFGRGFYSFDDRYLLTATIRRDGSSKFADGNRWGWFPSAAVAWKISNESFLKDNDVLNNLKLRLGWGTTGNQNVYDWAYMALLAQKTTPWGIGVLNANTPNPDLKWETTYSTNLGLDVNLFNNRIEFIIDAYYKKTADLLFNLPLPAYLGSYGPGAANNPWANIGTLENKGVEFTLNTVNIDKKDFQWRSNFVFSLNRNNVKSLNTDNSFVDAKYRVGSENATVTMTKVGEPIGQFYGWKVIGRFNTATDFYYKDDKGNVVPVALPEGVSIGENGAYIGDYIFADLNSDGVIDEKDKTTIGNPEPKFTYGIGNTFSYKGFDLTVFLSGSYGNDVMNYNRRYVEDVRANNNLLKTALNYAHISKIDPDGPNDYRNLYVSSGDAHMPRISSSSANGNTRISDLYVEDGSYLRIQNISFGYTLPKKWMKKIDVQNVKVFTNLQNVYTWTKYSGYDPEIGYMNGNPLLNGVDYGRYPSPRIITFGLNVSF